jgi:hypothetical protein
MRRVTLRQVKKYEYMAKAYRAINKVNKLSKIDQTIIKKLLIL